MQSHSNDERPPINAPSATQAQAQQHPHHQAPVAVLPRPQAHQAQAQTSFVSQQMPNIIGGLPASHPIVAGMMNYNFSPSACQTQIPTGATQAIGLPQHQHQQQQQQIIPCSAPGYSATGGINPLMVPHQVQFQGQAATAFFSVPTAMPSTAFPALLNMQGFIPPSLFDNQKPRSGKWLKEEEEYAEALLRLFDEGQLTDCENGCTLRSYLSRKLNCPPMRISKKYAGKGIGKKVFLSKVGAEAATPELAALEADAREKEQRFYRASFPSLQFFQVTIILC